MTMLRMPMEFVLAHGSGLDEALVMFVPMMLVVAFLVVQSRRAAKRDQGAPSQVRGDGGGLRSAARSDRDHGTVRSDREVDR